MPPLTDPLGPDLKATLRSLKLGKLTATLPERLTLARQNNMPHADFLQLVLSDEVTRREAGSIALRARNAGLDPAMRTETWDPTAAIRYDQQLWNELVSLRFLDAPYGALILGPVGVGKTHLATALGHIAIRRRRPVVMARAENDHVRADAARERDAQAAACTAQIHTIQALAGTWQARAEHAEQQLSLERDHQRRLEAASPAPGGTPAGGGTRPARAAMTASTSQP
jgi:hypothetical protein